MLIHVDDVLTHKYDRLHWKVVNATNFILKYTHFPLLVSSRIKKLRYLCFLNVFRIQNV